MRVIRGAWSDETAHARGKQSGRSLVEAKADCVTERVKRLRILQGLSVTAIHMAFIQWHNKLLCINGSSCAFCA